MSAIGHNAPPPFEGYSLHIEDLFEAAQQFLDGEPIQTQDQADEIGRLLDALRQSKRGADEQRAIEKRPHDEAAKAVQSKWKPLLDKCDFAVTTAKRALEPFLAAQEAEKRAAAAAARAEAERLAQEARDAAANARADDLAAQAAVEAQRKAAAAADRQATKADKSRAHVAGGAKAIGLRSHWSPVITDRRAALNHYARTQPEALEAWLIEQAGKDVASGSRVIPGFDVVEERRAA